MNCNHDWRIQLSRFFWECPKCGAILDFEHWHIYESLEEFLKIKKQIV